MKIVVVMSAKGRQHLLTRSLKSMETTRAQDVELVIVDDASNQPLRFPTDYRFPIWSFATDKDEKFWTTVPAVPFNRGIQCALGLGADVIVLQSPECLHVGDVLSRVLMVADRGIYLTFACFGATEEQTIRGLEPGEHHRYPAETCSNGAPGWFNHSVYRPAYLEFCAAIHRDDMLRLNGYDERFADGVACGDCDLLRRIRNAEMTLAICDDPFVVHQWHYDEPDCYHDTARFRRNQKMLFRLEAREPKGVKAARLFTEDFFQ